MISWAILCGAFSLATFLIAFGADSSDRDDIRAIAILLMGQYLLSMAGFLFSPEHMALYPASDAACGMMAVCLWWRRPNYWLAGMAGCFLAAGAVHVWYFDSGTPPSHRTYDMSLNGIYAVQTVWLARKSIQSYGPSRCC